MALVDDDASVRKATSRLLRTAGLDVRGFATAAEFLESYESAAVGCLVLDVTLPGLRGLELQRVQPGDGEVEVESVVELVRAAQRLGIDGPAGNQALNDEEYRWN